MNMKYEELLLKMRPQDRHGFAHAGIGSSGNRFGLCGLIFLMKRCWFRLYFGLVMDLIAYIRKCEMVWVSYGFDSLY